DPDHAYDAMVCPVAAVLVPAGSATLWPGFTVVGGTTTAIGRNAASTAPGAFAIPAPHVSVVQLHSVPCTSAALTGTWHIGIVGSLETGNGDTAPSRNRDRSCAAPRWPLTDSIRP